jgi:ribosomal protein L31E
MEAVTLNLRRLTKRKPFRRRREFVVKMLRKALEGRLHKEVVLTRELNELVWKNPRLYKLRIRLEARGDKLVARPA